MAALGQEQSFRPGMAKGISGGWPMVLSGLKSFLETGKAPNIMSIKSCSAQAPAKVA